MAGFIFPHTDTPKMYPILGANPCRGTFRGVCFCALHGCMQNLAGFIVPAHGHTKNAPDFILSNKDTPKTSPVLHPNLRRGVFRGVCFCAPIRVRAKPARFHIPAPEYTKNAPDFTHPNRDMPKTCPISPFPIRIYPKPARFWTQTFGEAI